jgi:hypothetical protein
MILGDSGQQAASTCFIISSQTHIFGKSPLGNEARRRELETRTCPPTRLYAEGCRLHTIPTRAYIPA